MDDNFISRGFAGRREQPETEARLPPGQYSTFDFPVLSAGPTPQIPLNQWKFTVDGLVHMPVTWTWEEFLQLPAQQFVADIHCVTKWSKLDTYWEGVSVETLLDYADPDSTAKHVIAYCYGDYTMNLHLVDLLNDQAFIVHRYEGEPLTPAHGGPARLVVPHLYFWKSAKWVRGLYFTENDEPGFWESRGYHNRGDPWKEQRYSGD